MLINITVAHQASGTLVIPYMIYLYLCVLFFSKQNAWCRVSFQSLQIISSNSFIPSSFLAYNFPFYGMHEEDNHDSNTVITALEASWSNYFTIRYINTNSDKLYAGKRCWVVWQRIPELIYFRESVWGMPYRGGSLCVLYPEWQEEAALRGWGKGILGEGELWVQSFWPRRGLVIYEDLEGR